MVKSCNLWIASLALSLILNGACSDFLDISPNRSIRVARTISDYQALLDHENVMNLYGSEIDIISSDDVYLTPDRFNARTEHEREYYVWQSNGKLEVVPNAWSRIYSSIFHANTAIDGLNNLPRTEANKSDWDLCMGGALFFRGKHHLKAANLWGTAFIPASADTDLGIPLKHTPDIYEPTIRYTMKETMGQIREDLELAASLLPESVSAKTRPSKAAAFGYLVRVAMMMNDYPTAIRFADSCLSYQRELLNYNLIDWENATPFLRFNEEVIIHFSCEKPLHNHYLINPDLYATYNQKDLRKKLFFEKISEDEVMFIGGYDHLRVAFPFTGLTTAEIWLSRAEALALEGQTERSISDLAHVLQHRYEESPFDEIENEELVGLIRSERRKELVFRGTRWFDMKRLNGSGDGKDIERVIDEETFSLPTGSRRYALPIPEQIIQVSGIAQN